MEAIQAPVFWGGGMREGQVSRNPGEDTRKLAFRSEPLDDLGQTLFPIDRWMVRGGRGVRTQEMTSRVDVAVHSPTLDGVRVVQHMEGPTWRTDHPSPSR